MTTPLPLPTTIQSTIWRSTIPLHITLSPSLLTSSASTIPTSPVTTITQPTPTPIQQQLPYLISFPRLSYLPLLLPQLHAFFRVDPAVATTFSYEGIVLRNLPVGLLFDLYVGFTGGLEGEQEEGEEGTEGKGGARLPWRLVLGEGPSWDIRDTFVNSVKEADFMRNGTARGIMSLSKEDSDQLWNAVKDNDLNAYTPIQNKLLSSAQPLRHIPLRIYIPTPPSSSTPPSNTNSTNPPTSPPGLGPGPGPQPKRTSSHSPSTTPSPRPLQQQQQRQDQQPLLGSFKTIQSLITPRFPLPASFTSSSTSTSTSTSTTTTAMRRTPSLGTTNNNNNNEIVTLGSALNHILPHLFPSRRDAILAEPILHGVKVPFEAPIEDVMREAGYADGWVGVVVSLLG